MKFPLMRNNIAREDLDAVIELLREDDPILTNGPKVREFEQQWSTWLGVKHSVFVNSGSSANLLSMSILKTKHPEGGEVIVPPLTWISDIASVLQLGFTPVFVDINPSTLAMDNEKIIDAITDKTRAVFLTHIQGFNGLTDTLLTELSVRGIPLIEDVCESHGATHNGKKLGTLGLMSNFSFYYAHHMTTIEGGMICTDDDEIYQLARMLRSHGMVRESNDAMYKEKYIAEYPDLNPSFIFTHCAYNVRNTEIGAIMGLSQLKRLDQNNEQRTANQALFFELIDKDKYQTDFYFEGSSNYAFNLVLKEPDMGLAEKLMQAMDKAGIEYRRGSAGGGNQLRQPYLKSIIKKDHHKEFPVTEHIHFFGFYIGNFPDLSSDDIREICNVLNHV